MTTPQPPDEAGRVTALRETGLLDSPEEFAFDDMARLASHICRTPMAAVTLVDEHRQWFKASVGLAISETAREWAFCAHTICQSDLFIVEDALTDPRFANNPLVTGGPRIRFYAGMPLTARDGHALGSLCVIDRAPRQLTDTERDVLRALGRQTAAMLDLRRTLSKNSNYSQETTRLRDLAMADLREKSEQLAAMSHEVRTPINGVMMALNLLLETRLDDEQFQLACLARRGGEALLDVLNDVLDFSKIEAGGLLLDNVPFDLVDTLYGAVELAAEAGFRRGIEVTVDADPQLPPAVLGDPGRLRQVIANLVANAVKFTRSGEVVVTAEPAATGVSITIRDTGIGMTAAEVSRLFQPYRQAHAGIAREFGGTGLGLAICQRLVRLMEGEITVSSRRGEGSTFQIQLPLAPAPAPGREPGPALAGRRVLIVDHHPANRKSLGRWLAAWGAVSAAAVDVNEALGFLRAAHPWDAVLIDLQLPDGGALNLARSIGEAGLAQPVLGALGWTGGSAAEAVADAGFSFTLLKPVHPARLLDRLSAALAGSPRPTPTAGLPDAAKEIGRGLRVLLAEDNPINQRLGSLQVQRLGALVDVAGTGLEAVLACGGEVYDVVLMDCQMPDMDGLEASTVLRKRLGPAAQGHSPYIIALTGEVSPESRRACSAAGMDDFVAKPVKTAELADALARARTALTERPRVVEPAPGRLQASVQ